jgi:hypothetical protein
MDLTASIRSKIDVLRTAKTTRYNALASAVEREVVILTHRNAALFNKLEDALEADVLPKPEGMEKLKEEEGEFEPVGEEEEEGESVAAPSNSIKGKHTVTVPDEYHIDEDVKDMYYGTDAASKYYEPHTEGKGYYDPIETRHAPTSLYAGIRPPSRTPSLASKAPAKKPEESITTAPTVPSVTDLAILAKPSIDSDEDGSVASLRKRAEETQSLLSDKHTFLSQLRQKHDMAMKRLDKLQTDLEKVSQKWEEEERTRIQSESTTALGKRKREEDGAGGKNWKKLAIKSVEMGIMIGVGVVGTLGMEKFQRS